MESPRSSAKGKALNFQLMDGIYVNMRKPEKSYVGKIESGLIQRGASTL